MDNKISTDFIHQSQLVRSKMRTIEGALARSSITDRTFHSLTQKLNATQKILHTIKEQSGTTVFAKVALEALEKEYVSLCGRVNDQWYRNKVDRIQDKASRLEDSIAHGKVTAQAIQELSYQMQSFHNEHLPSLEDKRKLAQAKLTVHRAHAFLNGEQTNPKQVSTSNEDVEIDLNEMEESEALMEIAYRLHFHDILHARAKYHALPDKLKKRFLEHMAHLSGKEFTDSLKTQQALIALARELLHDVQDYPTSAQIDEEFAGLSQVLFEEQRIFSLRSRTSL